MAKKTSASRRKQGPNQHLTTLLDSAYRNHKQGNLSQAELLYHQVLQEEPGNPFSLYGLGTIDMAKGEMSRAIPLLSEAVNNGYLAETAYTHLGIALQACGRADEALAVYRNGMTKDPRNPRYPSNASVVLAQKGDFEAALREADRAIHLDPSFPGGYINAGAFLTSLGRISEAAIMLEKALGLDPANEEVRHSLEGLRQRSSPV